VIRFVVVFTSAAAKVIAVVVFDGKRRNLSPTLRILENEVPAPFTRTEPEDTVTVPPPVTFPLI